MHKKTSAFFALVIGFAATTPALAVDQGEAYLGGGYTMFNFEEDGAPDFEPSGLNARLGYGIADNFAIEGRIGGGTSGDSKSVNGNSLEIEVDSTLGVYGVGYIPFADIFSVYGLVGFSRVDGSSTASVGGNSQSSSGDDTDFSYGAGAEVAISEEVSGYAEWVRLNDEDGELTGITVGAKYSF